MASLYETKFAAFAGDENKVSINHDNSIQNFEILEKAPEQHHYFSKSVDETHLKTCSKYLKNIRKEICILQHSLPQGIFVKAFENRSDLFSAMIVGPENTPYEGGLFFFDIQLPSNYPQSPPKFFYHSYNDPKESCRINPNLYQQGCVCLSILNTYDQGPRWDPKNSSLLQVLVSIQGLILVEEPFWNEPHLFIKKEETRNTEVFGINFYANRSEKTNRHVLLLVFKSLINILENSPDQFENEIRRHLKFSFDNTLQKLKNWIKKCDSSYQNKDEVASLDDLLVLRYPMAYPDKHFIREFNFWLNELESAINKKIEILINNQNDASSNTQLSYSKNQLTDEANSKAEEAIKVVSLFEERNPSDEKATQELLDNSGETSATQEEETNQDSEGNDGRFDLVDTTNVNDTQAVPIQAHETSILIDDDQPESFQGYDYDTTGGPPQEAEALKIYYQGIRFYMATTSIGIIIVLLGLIIGTRVGIVVAGIMWMIHFLLGWKIDTNARKNFSGSMATIKNEGISVLFGNPYVRSRRHKLRFLLFTLSFATNVIFYTIMMVITLSTRL